MLASGADVKIGTREFMLATDVEEPYIHQYENLYPTQSEIVGTDKKNANQNVLLWSYDNFLSGDGQNYFDKDQPAKWWTGNNNPRAHPGSIQGTPTRAQASQTTAVTPTDGGFTSVAGTLWYFTGVEAFFSTDNGATWTENASFETAVLAVAGTTEQVTAVCNDGEFPYAAIITTTNRAIFRCESTTTTTTVVSSHASTAKYKGIAVREGYLFGWTGGILFRYTLDQAGGTLPITHSATTHRKYRINAENPSGTVYADVQSGDGAVVMLRAYDGMTQLHEFKIDPLTNRAGGRKFWDIPDGFTGKKFCIHAGIIFVLGDYQDKLALWGYSIANKAPVFLGYVGVSVSANNVRFISPSYGAQVLIGVDDATTSYIYIYDAEEDAFSQLDERTIASDGTLLAGVTSRRRRVTAAFSTTTTKFNRWNLDTDAQTNAWDWDSAAFDFDYPQDEKVLLGFHVVQDPTFGSGTVTVAYQLDEDGVWNSLTATSAGAKHTYIQVSDGSTTKKFRTLRMRMTGASGCRVFSITARAYVNTKQEVWRLTLDLRNEAGSLRRPSTRSSRAATLRDYLHTLVTTGSVITFLDGRRYPIKSATADTGYKSHTCLIEFPKDSIDAATEGRCEVILRSVAPSA